MEVREFDVPSSSSGKRSLSGEKLTSTSDGKKPKGSDVEQQQVLIGRITQSPPHQTPDRVISSPKQKNRDENVSFLGSRVAKFFFTEDKKKPKNRLYLGTVSCFYPAATTVLHGAETDLWNIEYDDGDSEDLNRTELKEALELYETKSRMDPYPCITEFNEIGHEFLHYLHFRMVVWMQRYPKRALEETVAKQVPDQLPHSEKLAWRLLACATTGNVYRHLDSGTVNVGKMVRLKVSNDSESDPNTWTDDQVEGAFLMCVIQMAGFRPEVIRNAFDEWQHNLPLAASYPSNQAELKTFVKYLKCLSKQRNRPTMFKADYQTQGFRWIRYFEKSFTKQNLREVVQTVRQAKTWMEAVQALETLHGIGPYYGAQTLCTLYMGVWQRQKGLFQHHDAVTESMNDQTGAGPGPRLALAQIFGKHVDFDHGLKTLQRLVADEFVKLGIDFTYLKSNNAAGGCQSLSCVDLEHSLCYFHRYLASRCSLGPTGVTKLYGRFQNPEFARNVPLQKISSYQHLTADGVDTYCDNLLHAIDSSNE